MANGPDKRALREASERIEKGIEAYAAGDLPSTLRELEEAVKLLPGHVRAQLYLGWVRDLQSGKRRLDAGVALDEDTLMAVADALSPEESSRHGFETSRPGFNQPSLGDEEKTREKRHPSSPGMDSPWDPVPLTPGGKARTPGMGVPVVADPEERAASATTSTRTPPPQSSPRDKPVSGTLLGVAPIYDSLLTPGTNPKSLYATDEQTGSVTREWRSTPTGTNLPLLDVPELTDEQIQELLALDGSPMLGIDPPRQPEEHATLEMDAEPTPEPHRNPLPPHPLPPGTKRRDATTPDGLDHELPPPVGFGSGEFDAFEQTPTRDRRDLLKAVAEADVGSSEDDLQLPPLEVPRDLRDTPDDGQEEGGTNPTNPFINRRLAEYAPSLTGTGTQPKVDDLPLPPGGLNDTSPHSVMDGLSAVQDPLERGDLDQAFTAAEAFIAQNGGLESEECQAQRWLFERVYETMVGPLGGVPTHGEATPDLDPKAAFLLSRIDGMSSVDDLLDVSGMPRIDALRCLAILLKRGVVTVR